MHRQRRRRCLGPPYEGPGPKWAAKLFADTSKQHLLFGKGMVSDDTESACFTAQALVPGV